MKKVKIIPINDKVKFTQAIINLEIRNPKSEIETNSNNKIKILVFIFLYCFGFDIHASSFYFMYEKNSIDHWYHRPRRRVLSKLLLGKGYEVWGLMRRTVDRSFHNLEELGIYKDIKFLMGISPMSVHS